MPGIDFPSGWAAPDGRYVRPQKMTPTTGMDPTRPMMLIMMPAMMLLISYIPPASSSTGP
jgi:hypothetical protein